MEQKDYYIGLDCGTSSVGWAVTDENYNILRKKGKALWGSRLFEEANTAAERRLPRSTRRRTSRAKNRLKLLRMLFADEIAKVDPDFYIRLRESFYLEEDKDFSHNPSGKSKNTLFNDPDFQDKDFHKKYPTIWHLRNAIYNATDEDHFDIRLYFLAIQHILKNRGHFLIEGELSDVEDFNSIWFNFVDAANNRGFNVADSVGDTVAKIIKDRKRSKIDRKKELKDLIFIEDEETDETLDRQLLAGFLIGSTVDLCKMLGIEDEEYKYSLDDGNFEDKQSEIELAVGPENMDLINAAKRIYDFGILDNLMAGYKNISAAMVNNYNLHETQLKELKELLKPFSEDYNKFFKSTAGGANYNSYIHKAYSVDNNGRRKTVSCSQEDINKEIKRLLKKHDIKTNLISKAENNQLLPKQRGQAKGTIPQQIHAKELKVILKKLTKDYPSFATKNPNEDEKYNTKAKKIQSIHSFRIPYYCGPLVKRKYDNDGKEINSGRNASEFSWADDEIKEIVYPWNFENLVNLEDRANNFIRRMTNECTYLLGEDVLPKSSLAYQKYMVLNQLNNLSFNGKRIDQATKIFIYEHIYLQNELTSNITLKRLKKYLVENNICDQKTDLREEKDLKTLPKLKTHHDFASILGEDYAFKYSRDSLEKVVELITVLGNEKKMLKSKIIQELNCSDEQALKLSRKSYTDWGNFSNKFLNGIRATVNGQEMTMLEALENTTNNLMELLSKHFDFSQKIEDYNTAKRPQNTELTYDDVKNLYCSPAVKRGVWQTIKIVKEIKDIFGYAPKKVFIEVTRGEEKNKKLKLSRKKELEEKYKAVKTPEAQELLASLKSYEDRDLQSKKLFLYFSQMGRCAYSGERIDIERLATDAYDIDHIIPRSFSKDDSITRNLVLVKAEYNREKTNHYPIEENWRNRMRGTWAVWADKGFITKEKFMRLTRATPLTDDELGGFIARQIVETSQTTKAIRDLLQQAYPDTKVVLVKAGHVSDFRHVYGRNHVDENGNYISPQFIKVRALNDFHHAKDAYLNIVVGNVLNSTFTDSPYNFIKNHPTRNYSIRTSLIFRRSEQWKTIDGHIVNYPQVKAWNYQESFDIVSKTLERNDILWTRMTYQENGNISDLLIVGKSQKTEGILPIKQTKRLADTSKYGGYNSVKGAYFALIETDTKRQLVQIPILAKDNPEKYISANYSGARTIIPRINFKSYLKVNGFPVHLAGRTGNNLAFWPAFQLELNYFDAVYLANIVKLQDKLKIDKKYEINEVHDKVSSVGNVRLLNALLEKLEYYKNAPQMGSKVDEIISHSNDFKTLDIKDQISTLCALQNAISCNAIRGDISSFVPKASQYGLCTVSNNISNLDSCYLILQSPTGLRERKIDLKTTPSIKLSRED
ncbi:MAG: type II CRISPR RNA-guided endonuclease Cas9 [Candidatus Nanosyncoccaceae bacterium]